jgi:hypothetical protein
VYIVCTSEEQEQPEAGKAIERTLQCCFVDEPPSAYGKWSILNNPGVERKTLSQDSNRYLGGITI